MGIKASIDMAADRLCRPQRAEYTDADLEPYNRIAIGDPDAGATVLRQAFVTKNSEWNHNLPTSVWALPDSHHFVVFLHGNASCQLQFMPRVSDVLATGFSVCAFDFGGCGLANGSDVTYGIKEVDDLSAIIEFLKTEFGPGIKVLLWGHSMGAGVALQFQGNMCENSDVVIGIIADSSFSSMSALLAHHSGKALGLGIEDGGTGASFILKSKVADVSAGLVARSIRKRFGHDVGGISVYEAVKTCDVPVLIIHGTRDEVIPWSHALYLKEAASRCGKPTVEFFRGGHNDERPPAVVQKIFSFLRGFE